MSTIIMILSLVVSLNTLVISALTYLYLKNKNNYLEDEGTTGSIEEN